MRPLWSLTVSNPHLTALFSSVSHLASLLSICSLVPHSPSASCTLLLLPTLQHLRPTILTSFEYFLPNVVTPPQHYLHHLLPYFCFLLCRTSVLSSTHPCTLLLIILFFTFLSLPPPPLCPVLLSLSHSSLSPADSAGISVHRDHMTISPIGSPPPPMSSYRLAPFPAKSRPVGAALTTMRRPSGWAVHNIAPLLFHAGLDPPPLLIHDTQHTHPPLPSQPPGNR